MTSTSLRQPEALRGDGSRADGAQTVRTTQGQANRKPEEMRAKETAPGAVTLLHTSKASGEVCVDVFAWNKLQAKGHQEALFKLTAPVRL